MMFDGFYMFLESPSNSLVVLKQKRSNMKQHPRFLGLRKLMFLSLLDQNGTVPKNGWPELETPTKIAPWPIPCYLQ